MFKSIDIDAIPTSFRAAIASYSSNTLYLSCTSSEVLSFHAGIACAYPLYNFQIVLLDNCKFKIVATEKWTAII